MNTDPTMQLIADLDDPSKFVRKDRVAIFRPHVRKFPDGRTVTVTASDLREIASNVNRAYAEDGELVRLVIGHRKQKPDVSELEQPLCVGYARNLKAELVRRPAGPVLRLTQTEYVKTEYEREAGRHPGRSPEYDPATKMITAVALLTRDPALKLGTVAYDSSSGLMVYQQGADMADEKDDDDKKKPDDDWTEDDEIQYAKMCYRRSRLYAGSNEMRGKNMAGQIAAMNAKDPLDKEERESLGYQAGNDVVLALQQQVSGLQKQRVAETAKRLLDPLTSVVRFDYAREVGQLVSYQTDEQRGQHVQYMLANYEKLPTGQSPFPIALGSGSPGSSGQDWKSNPMVAPPNYDRILAYMDANPGVSYDAAETAIAASK